jgi:ornithine carbamoyltransferase
MIMNLKGRSFLTLLDFSSEELEHLIDLAIALKHKRKTAIAHHYLQGKNIVILFQKDSTRTRCAFEVGARDLGMGVTYLGPSGSQMGEKESINDTARVLGRMYDAIEFRGYLHADVVELAEHAGVPVYNGLTDLYHPTQALSDLFTIKERFNKLAGIKLTYIGDARNNVANSLMIAAAKFGVHFTAVAPRSLWPEQKLVDRCKEIAKQTKADIKLTEDIEEGTRNVDIIYTDVWVSMGEPKEVWDGRIKMLIKYQVDRKVMANAGKNAIFMHCLPAFHGIDTVLGAKIANEFGGLYPQIKNGEMEVTDEVFESSQSLVFEQAENRLHSIKAIMLATLADHYE